MKLAQIKNNKVVAFFDDEDELPDSSHFVNVDDLPEVKVGDKYKDGKFEARKNEALAE